MIVVNPSTRQFNIPGADLVFGVTADASAVIKEFQCPRYVGNNLDLTGCFIRMNYRNANGEVDSYLVSDVTVDGDNIVFGWELSPRVTMYKGNVSFVMCVVGPDTKVAWHTTLGRGQVLEGLEPEWESVMDETVDVVAQLIAMVEAQTKAVADTGAEWVRNVQSEGTDQIVAVQTAGRESREAAVAEIEAKGVSTLATIPEDYTTVQNAVRGAANAIRGKVSGEVIRVDDVSPMEHYPMVKVCSKNLIPFPYYNNSITQRGVKITVAEDGTITFNGTAEGNSSFRIIQDANIPVNGKYTLTGCDGGAVGTYYLQPFINGVAESSLLSGKKTYEWDGKLTSLAIFFKVGTVFDNVQFRPHLEKGDIATNYTPYVDPTTVTVTRCGKNLFDVSDHKFNWENVTLNSSDGNIYDVTGATGTTAMAYSAGAVRVRLSKSIPIRDKITISFYMTLVEQGMHDNRIRIWSHDGEKSLENTTVTLTPGVRQKVSMVCNTVGGVLHSVMIYVNANRIAMEVDTLQVEVGDTATNYEPYTGETQIPSSDGTISGLTAVSPTMTLLTDTAGVNIECEYSRDTNVVIAEILEKITALGG